MNRKLKLLSFLLMVFLNLVNLANKSSVVVKATYVEGPITQDTVWTLVDSPFVISKDVEIYPGATLTIEPGVVVKFGGAFSLIVSGRLYANGIDKTITFTSNEKQPGQGDWNAIVFKGIEMSTLVGCFIAYGTNGIRVENGDVEVRNSTVSSCSESGISVEDGRLTLQDCIVMENEINGIFLTGIGQVIIQRNTIIANKNGILITGNLASGVSISQNVISANDQNGIKIDADSHSNIDIVNNSISSNNKGLYISTLTSTNINNNSISYNNIGAFYDNGSHLASYNDIYGNQVGMDVVANATVDAEDNYWGHRSGPYHISLNPTGKGNPAGGNGINLDFIFFLTNSVNHVNALPTATLLTDRALVPPDAAVMFIATGSTDEGRIDWYYFNFGDGNESGWTTLSIFTHKYSSSGTYSATVTVMDDFGGTNSTTVTIDVAGGLSVLDVNVDASDYVIHEGEEVSVNVYVKEGTVAVENATVTMFSVKGGEFAPSYGLTDGTGYFTTTFTASDIAEIANVRIIARASKSGYTDGSDYKYLEVIPFLSVQITASPNRIKSEETTTVTVLAESNEQPVADASVTIWSDSGSLYPEAGTTDSNGEASFVFMAPQTTESLDVTVTATVTKDGFIDGVGQGIVTIEPRILVVQVLTESNVTVSEAKFDVTIHVEYDTIPIAGANVTITAEGGEFSTNTKLTDFYGNATFEYTAPPVNEQTDITMVAQAGKTRYADGEGQLSIRVNPKTFDVQIDVSPSTVESEEIAIVSVNVTCKEDGEPVSDANVTVSSSDGSFQGVTGTTGSNGLCTFVFDAPQTAAQLSISIIVNVTRDGYLDGGNETTITVTPGTSAGGGWPLTTMLLIIVPIVIVVIVVVLFKLKIITLSSEEEEM